MTEKLAGGSGHCLKQASVFLRFSCRSELRLIHLVRRDEELHYLVTFGFGAGHKDQAQDGVDPTVETRCLG